MELSRNQMGGARGGSRGRSGQELQDDQRRQLLEALLNKLDAQAAADPARVERRNTRVNYRRFSVPIRIHHPGGTSALRNVLTRDLSAGGLSFIHNGYVHINTRIEALLRRHEGGEDVIHGVVMHCQHIGGTWHVVGVKLDKRIFPKLYVDPDQAGPLTSVTGSVLHLEAQDLDRRLFAHHLRNTSVALTGCTTLEEARQHLHHKPFDLVVLDLNLDTTDDDEAASIVDQIRDTGFTGPIAVCTAETRPALLAAVESKGIVGLIRKPYEAQAIITALGGWLSGPKEAGKPIHSPLADQPDSRILVSEYTRKTKVLIRDLRDAIARQDVQKCRTICLILKGTGSGYGFPQVTTAADEAITILDKTSSLAESEARLQTLLSVCARLSPEPGGENAEAA